MSSGRTARRPYVCLDLGFYSDPKILGVGLRAAGLFASALAYSGDHLTDGFVPGKWARQVGTTALCNKLVGAGLWQAVDGGYLIAKWDRYQLTKAEIEESRRQKQEAGKKGAEARWNDGTRHGISDGTRHSNRDGKEKENVKEKKTLTSSYEGEQEQGLPAADELRRLAESNGLNVPAWALDGTQEKDVAF
jgi:hypothetical protein